MWRLAAVLRTICLTAGLPWFEALAIGTVLNLKTFSWRGLGSAERDSSNFASRVSKRSLNRFGQIGGMRQTFLSAMMPKSGAGREGSGRAF